MAPLNHQEGTALVSVMMVLLILTFLGTTAFLTSTTELKISGNYTQSLRALYAAETGLQALLAVYRRNPEGFLLKKSGEELAFPTVEPELENGPGSKYWLVSLRYDSQISPAFAEAVVVGQDVTQKAQCRIRATIFCRAVNGSDPVPDVFKVGLVTAGALRLQDPLAIRSSIHGNQGYSIDPPAVVEQLRTQQFLVTQSLDPGGPDYQPFMEIPVIPEKGFQEYQLRAQNGENLMLVGSQRLLLAGDQNNRLLYVDGDVTLTGAELSGLTVVATGSITLNGSVVLKEGSTLNSAFFAGGDILLNDFSQLAGVFWANGSIVRSGSGKISGTMVCQGSLSFGPGFQFERVTSITDVFFYSNQSRYSFTVKGWSQL